MTNRTERQALKELAPYLTSAAVMLFLWGGIAANHQHLAKGPRVVERVVASCKLLPPPAVIARR